MNMIFFEYIKSWFVGIRSLGTGMCITMREFWRPKVTECYPENRATLKISERFRGELTMPHNAQNEHKCTGCGICQMNCPNSTIKITTSTIETEDGKKKKVLDEYFYNLGQCSFCGMCVQTCPQNAIRFVNTFEHAVFTPSKLTKRLNKEHSRLEEKKKSE
jgi:NADH-quinone oxidoreductase subunit I